MTRAWTTAAFAVSLLIVIWCFSLFQSVSQPEGDFRLLYRAASLLIEGESFWTTAFPSHPGGHNVLLAPPNTVSIYAPLTLLPEAQALFVWRITLFLLTFVVVMLSGPRTVTGTLAACIFCSLFEPFWDNIGKGQLSTVVALGAAIVLTGRGGISSGCGLFLLTLKPHLTAPLLCFEAMRRLRSRDYRALLVCALLTAALASFPLVLRSSIYDEFFSQPNFGHWLPLSFPAIAQHYLFPSANVLRFIPALILTGWALIWGCRPGASTTAAESKSAMFYLIAGEMLVSPYVWTYDYVLLLPLLLPAFKQLDLRRAAILAAIAAVLWIARTWNLFFALNVPLLALLLLRSSKLEPAV